MQTAGLVLDLYDNPRALTSIFPSIDVIPEQVKTAEALTSEMLEALPDDVFALVLLNGDDRLRKYACVDAGNTLLNVAFFFQNGHKLPEEAQKTAAANLIEACGWYDIPVPEELEKVAMGLNTVMTALTAPSVIKGSMHQVHDNLAANAAVGNQVLTPNHQHAIGNMLKGAEASGTSLMPAQGPGNLEDVSKRGAPGTSNSSVQKAASTGHLVQGHNGDTPPELETSRGAAGEQYDRAPQAKLPKFNPYVGVVNKEPPKMVVEKKASHYAYGNVFPLDSYLQVQSASSYFDEHVREMDPEMRHVFATNLVKRASLIGVPFSKTAAEYGSETFAPDEHIRIALDTRRPFLQEKQASLMDELFEHRAEIGPEAFCDTLYEFDKLACIDHRYDAAVLDPYASTFGLQKQADDRGDSWVSGNDYVTRKQIENYAVTAGITLADDYGPEFKKEFMKDPWGIFMTLPLEQRRRMARSASDNGATGLHDVQ